MQDSTLHELGYTARVVHRALHDRLEDLGLYPGQPKLLSMLGKHDGSTQREIGEKLDIRPATLTKMVGRMEQAGFVIRKRNSEDARSVHVFLTPKAQETLALLEKNLEAVEEKAFSGFSKEEDESLRMMMRRIRKNLGVDEEAKGRCRR